MDSGVDTLSKGEEVLDACLLKLFEKPISLYVEGKKNIILLLQKGRNPAFDDKKLNTFDCSISP
jgi:hypothetical protein